MRDTLHRWRTRIRPRPASADARSAGLRLGLFLVNALILTALVLAAYGLDVLDGPELDTIDARFEIRGDRGGADDVVVVEIDDVSFNDLDRTGPRITRSAPLRPQARASAPPRSRARARAALVGEARKGKAESPIGAVRVRMNKFVS
jgi:CHASE2 domain-containing sensor protein